MILSGIGIGQLADEEWARKLKTGREDEIRSWIGCLHCFKTLKTGKHILVRLTQELDQNSTGRLRKRWRESSGCCNGGGPGGMQAALVLAKRNYKRVLFEQSTELGGTLNIADKPLLKRKLHDPK